MTWPDPQGQPDWRDPYGRYGQGQSPYDQEPSDDVPYGQSPYGHDPYGQAPYGQSPYGQAPYGPPPYGQYPQDPYGQYYSYGAYGPGGVPRNAGNGAAVAALVANIVCAVLCCAGLLWIPGVITAGVAMNRVNTDPESARKLTVAAWVCFAANILLAVGVVIVFGVLGDRSGA
jgi:hypothetical protein